MDSSLQTDGENPFIKAPIGWDIYCCCIRTLLYQNNVHVDKDREMKMLTTNMIFILGVLSYNTARSSIVCVRSTPLCTALVMRISMALSMYLNSLKKTTYPHRDIEFTPITTRKSLRFKLCISYSMVFKWQHSTGEKHGTQSSGRVAKYQAQHPRRFHSCERQDQ